MGPKRLSNMSDHVAPATMGDTTTGSTSSATKICRPGRRSMKSCAIASPNSSSSGSAIAVNVRVCSSDFQSRVSSSRARKLSRPWNVVSLSVIVMPWKLTSSRYTSGNTPISSRMKMDGATSA